MSAQAHYKDKLDWPLINYLADRLVALEDIGIYCTLKVCCPGFYKDELHMNFSDVLLEYSNGEFEYKITHNSLKATVDKNYNKLANIYVIHVRSAKKMDEVKKHIISNRFKDISKDYMPEYMKIENNIILRRADQDIAIRQADLSRWRDFNYIKDKATKFEDAGATINVYMMVTLHDNMLCAYKYENGENKETINSLKLDGSETYSYLVDVVSSGNSDEVMSKFLNSIKDKFTYEISTYNKNRAYLTAK